MATVNSGNLPPIYERQIQLDCKQRVNTTFGGSGINESLDARNAGNRNASWIRHRIMVGIKANVYKQGGTMGDQQIAPRTDGTIVESTLSFNHDKCCTLQTQAV